jgi:hypothetical protein
VECLRSSQGLLRKFQELHARSRSLPRMMAT